MLSDTWFWSVRRMEFSCPMPVMPFRSCGVKASSSNPQKPPPEAGDLEGVLLLGGLRTWRKAWRRAGGMGAPVLQSLRSSEKEALLKLGNAFGNANRSRRHMVKSMSSELQSLTQP